MYFFYKIYSDIRIKPTENAMGVTTTVPALKIELISTNGQRRLITEREWVIGNWIRSLARTIKVQL